LARELAGESSEEESDFFHGVADPLEGATPGKTDIGFADALAATDLTDGLDIEAIIGVCVTVGAEIAG
jgi:hypothetical protein